MARERERWKNDAGYENVGKVVCDATFIDLSLTNIWDDHPPVILHLIGPGWPILLALNFCFTLLSIFLSLAFIESLKTHFVLDCAGN